MKSFAIACSLLMLFAATASAADLAVSKSTLGSMGLTSMDEMSDSEGLAVRGKGVSAAVWGGSQAAFGDSFSQNFYEAGATWHGPVGATANGGSLSFAAEFAVEFWADPTGFTLGVAAVGAISGGGAHASAY
jgi:hypothetical protein